MSSIQAARSGATRARGACLSAPTFHKGQQVRLRIGHRIRHPHRRQGVQQGIAAQAGEAHLTATQAAAAAAVQTPVSVDDVTRSSGASLAPTRRRLMRLLRTIIWITFPGVSQAAMLMTLARTSGLAWAKVSKSRAPQPQLGVVFPSAPRVHPQRGSPFPAPPPSTIPLAHIKPSHRAPISFPCGTTAHHCTVTDHQVHPLRPANQ